MKVTSDHRAVSRTTMSLVGSPIGDIGFLWAREARVDSSFTPMIQIEEGAPSLLVIRKKRHRPKVGDVFAFQLPDAIHRFGRVLHSAVPVYGKGETGAILVVAYRYEARSIEECPPRLLPKDIIGPPTLLQPRVWSRGYFVHVENRPIEPEEIPTPGPCFRDYDTYCDQDGNPMTCNPNLLGDWMGTGEFSFGDDVIHAVNEAASG